MAYSVELTGVCKSYTRSDGTPARALDGLSLHIQNKKLIAVIGSDGAGKSTLLNMLCGLVVPDSGSVSVIDCTPDANDSAFTERVGFMPQSFGLYKELSVMENFRLFAGLRGVPEQKVEGKAKELLKATDLIAFKERPAGKLSGGMKQKLALACSLAADPELLILDEPSVGVDPLSRRELWSIIRKLVASPEGPVCIFSTSDPNEAESAEYVLFLDNGKLFKEGTPADIIGLSSGLTFEKALPKDEAGRRTSVREGIENVKAAKKNSTVIDAVPEGDCLKLLLDARSKTALPEDLTERKTGLEDSYALLTLREKAALDTLPRTVRPSPDDEVIIRAKGIRRTFGNFVAVHDTTFDVRKGEIFGLLGPNGAGKTTTFRMLCGLLRPSSGEIFIGERDLLRSKLNVRARIGYVAQRFSLYGGMTVKQNLLYFGRSYGLSGDALIKRTSEMIEAFDLAHHENIAANLIPNGLQRNLAMATALIHEPDVLFLDEATSGADLAARRAFWRRVTALSDAGTTVIVTTHYMDEAEYCDRFLIQEAGRVIALGTPNEIRESADHASTIEEAFIRIVEKDRKAEEEKRKEDK